MLVDLDSGQVLQARWSPSDKGLKELWIQLGGMHHFHAVFMEQRHLQDLDVNEVSNYILSGIQTMPCGLDTYGLAAIPFRIDCECAQKAQGPLQIQKSPKT